MPWAAAAAVAGAVITSSATKSASKTQANAAKDASEVDKYIFDTTRADNMPALDARNASLKRLQDLLGVSTNTTADGYGSLNDRFTGADLENEPGYKFGLDQGLDAVQNSAAARGGFYSGATLKALTQYGNDYASTKYNDARNRFVSDQDTTFNRLTGLGTGGQTGSNAIAQAGQNYANGVTSNLIGAGNTRAASTIANANAWTNAGNQIGAWWQRQPAGGNAFTTPGSDGSYGNPTGDGYGVDPYGYLGGSSTAGDYSDARLKTEIRRVGTTDSGLAIYTYRYKSGGPVRMGVMAQEVEQVDPTAVTYDDDGFRLVNYAKVK